MSLVFSSCDLTGKMEQTPELIFRAMRIIDSDTTLLNFVSAPFDTISVGDTIHFQTLLFSEFNNLKEFSITPSRTRSVEFIWIPRNELDTIFTSASDYDRGIFVLPGTSSLLEFSFQYVALEADEDLTLTFIVVNDASRDFSTTTRRIRTPIRETEKEKEELD